LQCLPAPPRDLLQFLPDFPRQVVEFGALIVQHQAKRLFAPAAAAARAATNAKTATSAKRSTGR
jgi:hypothetical protein